MMVHPGWHAVVPCTHTISEIYVALELGNLHLPVSLSDIGQGHERHLRDLAAISAHQHSARIIGLTCRIVKGMRSVRQRGDAVHGMALQNTGELFYGSACYGLPGSTHLTFCQINSLKTWLHDLVLQQLVCRLPQACASFFRFMIKVALCKQSEDATALFNHGGGQSNAVMSCANW